MSDDPFEPPPSRVPEQLGMFGLAPTLAIHRVRAHSRVLADGTSVFVGEHLRWNRGTTHRVSQPRLPDTPAPGQLGLFEEPDEERGRAEAGNRP